MVGAGLGFGKTVESKECNRRAYAEQLFKLAADYKNPDFAVAGLFLIAENKEVRKALTEAGLLKPEPVHGTIESNRPFANAMDHTK